MTIPIITLFSSVLASFLAHHWGERILTRRGERKIRLVLKGYQIHHSFFGALAIAVAVAFTSGIIAVALFGYGLGNIWQHKKTHNAVNEKGIVFITKILR